MKVQANVLEDIRLALTKLAKCFLYLTCRVTPDGQLIYRVVLHDGEDCGPAHSDPVDALLAWYDTTNKEEV